MKTYWLQTGRNKKLITHISYKCKVKYILNLNEICVKNKNPASPARHH